MIKDRVQKEKALRYILSKDWFPQLELEVFSHRSTAKKAYSITDIDVLASIPDEFSGYRTLIFDCKTGERISPVSRALWQKGLMSRMRADRGICIVGRENIEADHRYTGAELGINILSDTEFDKFIECTSPRHTTTLGSLANIDAWDKYFSIPAQYKELTPAVLFSKSRYWLAESESEACRKTVGVLMQVRPELDPKKVEHLAIAGDICSLFMHSLSTMVSKIFSHYLLPDNRDELSSALLFLLYGGRDSYQIRNRIREMVIAKSEEKPSFLSLPDWDKFIQLSRQTLDSPVEVNKSALIIREIAWAIMVSNTNRDYVTGLCTKYPQGARFAIQGIDYLFDAVKMPPEFKEIYVKELMGVQKPK